MASKSVSINNYRTELPGKLINDDKIYLFNKIITDKREWYVYVALYKTLEQAKLDDSEKTNDYATSSIKIKDEYFDSNDMPDGYVAKLVAKSGLINGKHTTTTSYILNGKNPGKSNRTNQFTQALRDGLSKYNKRSSHGEHVVKSSKAKTELRYKPMLVQKEKDQKEKLNFDDGIIVQYKFDGVHFVMALENDNIVLYSRQRKDIPGFDEIRKLFRPVFEKYPNIRIDGEIYKHGMSLQEISGCVRKSSTECKNLDFYIFDVFIPCTEKSVTCPDPKKENDQLYSERRILAEKIYNKYLAKYDQIKLVDNYSVNNYNEIDKIFNEAINQNYEGIIIRKLNKPYRYSDNNYHSNYLLKRKKFETEEFPIIDFTEGEKGIAKGAIMWVCTNNYPGSELKKSEIKQFNVPPKSMDYETRYKIYNQYKTIESNGKTYFENNIKGKLLTIEFAQLSKDKVPQQPLGLTIRDYE